MDLILTPAYGRDYDSMEAVLADYHGGKDFVMQPQGCYISKRDVEKDRVVKFRYSKLCKVFYL